MASLPIWALTSDQFTAARKASTFVPGSVADASGSTFTAPASDFAQPATLSHDDIFITTSHGNRIRFQVEIATSPEQQARGLMFRYQLPRDEGMLFPFQEPRWASFWMKNTYIPLDIIFLSRNGTIVSIHALATPGSTTPIRSPVAVAAVLELLGGSADYFGLRPGNRIEHPLFE